MQPAPPAKRQKVYKTKFEGKVVIIDQKNIDEIRNGPQNPDIVMKSISQQQK